MLQSSSAIEGWCGRVFGREAVSETFRLTAERPVLSLARWPHVTLGAVVEDGVTLPPAAVEVDAASGEMWRLDEGDRRIPWPVAKITVTYTAGFRLPGDPQRDLPEDLERACLEAVKARWFARVRDPLVKGEQVQGVASADYWVPSSGIGDPGLPPAVIGLLQRYRLPTL